MKCLPKSRLGKIRFALLLLLLLTTWIIFRPDRVGLYLLSAKREGDILFQSLPRGPLVDAIEGVTESPWSHCGILLKVDGRWVVAESIGHVRYTPLYDWMLRGRRFRVESYRLRHLPEDFRDRVVAQVELLHGKFYDIRYAPEDDEIYCSELVYKVYDRGLGIKIGKWERFGDLNWKPFEAFIRETEGGPVPLERPMITPVGLTRSVLVEKVF